MLHAIRTKQLIKAKRQIVWDFISDPDNLATITPPYMGFKILSGTTKTMYPGQIIEYSVRPLLNIQIHWVTEITQVKEGEFFVDEQRFGPYAFWHHQHRLTEVADGVIMSDTVHYKLPLGLLGKLANQIAIKRQLAGIFSYRKDKLDEIFNQNR